MNHGFSVYMDRVEQLRQKDTRLLQQFDQGQTEPSAESLEAYQITREQFREGLLLLKMDADVKKQQLEPQVLTDASDREGAKDKMGVSQKEDAKSGAPKAGLGRQKKLCLISALKLQRKFWPVKSLWLL